MCHFPPSLILIFLSAQDSLESLHGVQENDATSSADILKRDAFLAFRFLCRLSVKVERAETGTTAASSSSAPATESPDDLSPLVLRTRALALEMIFALLNNAGNVLLTQEPFLTLIRQHLTFSVSKNGVLIHPALFELALSVFLHLLKSYRAPLKAEIEVLFHEIYLFILDNPNSAVKQKLMLLQGIFKMCSNAQLLVDIYLNYDCDMNAASIFERIVVSLGKLVQGSGLKIPIAGGSGGGTRMVGVLAIGEDATSESAILAERKLRTKSLRCLVALVHALADWMKESPREDGTSAAAAEMLDRATAVQSASVSETAGEQLRSPDSVGAASANSGTSETWRSTRASTDTESGGPAFESRPPIVLAGRNVLQTMSLRGNSPMTKSNSFSAVTTGDSGTADAPAPLAHPDDFERVKTKKNQWRQCISKFNESPGKGVAALREAGFLTDDESVCQFLRTTPELDKKAIGDFIGDGKETYVMMGGREGLFDMTFIEILLSNSHIAIMHRFVDSFEFAGIPFIDALRRFLNAFRLPGGKRGPILA